jgi:acyl-CoA synthetase (NDP forming)
VVCAGDGLDIGADDLLAWWAQDGRTRAAVLYLESVSRPHTFADLARRVGRHLPVVAIRSGSSTAGRRASHTASTATPRAVRDALLRSAGILTVDTPSRAAEALAALCWQPLPTGPRIAVVSNTGGAGVLAADACVRAGLTVATLSAETRSALSHLLPATAALAGPVDTTATVSPAVFACVLDVVAADTGVDAVVAIGAATDLADPLESVCGAGDGPLLAVRLGQAEGVAVLHPNSRPVPCYADPDAAAAALALALKRAHRLARTCVPVAPDKVDPARARAVIDAALDARPDGGWLDPAEVDELLRAAGIQTAEVQVVRDAEAAVARWRVVGGPVVLKAHVDGLPHKSRAGGVLVGRNTETAVREAVAILAERFGERLRGVVVQPMVDHGAELLVGVTGDAVFGPLLTVGLGGTSTDLVADHSHVLVPTSEADVDEALDELHSAARLFGPGGPDRAAVCDVALRMGWLAALLPEIAEAEINPLVAVAHSVLAVDARMRLAPIRPAPETEDSGACV